MAHLEPGIQIKPITVGKFCLSRSAVVIPLAGDGGKDAVDAKMLMFPMSLIA
jgi:hypothetical protein